MVKHNDFKKIYARFVKQYGEEKGGSMYFSWIKKKGFDDTKPLPKSSEKKEKQCIVHGLEIKEVEGEFHIEGLIATSHIDLLEDIPDRIPKITLEDFANQINTDEQSRIMGVHHSEGRAINPEYYGVADIEKTPAQVIPLSDGEWGLYVDTKLLINDPQTPEIIKSFTNGDLHSFSITYDTHGFQTSDFVYEGDTLIRELLPGTKLWGYTAASDPVNPQAIATNYGYKEFKELVKKSKEAIVMPKDVKEKKEEEKVEDAPAEEIVEEKVEEQEAEDSSEESEEPGEVLGSEEEMKEFLKYKKSKKLREEKEFAEKLASKITEEVVKKMEVKEKVLQDTNKESSLEVPLEIKEFQEAVEKGGVEMKEMARKAAIVCDKIGLDWQVSTTPKAESREYKSFGIANGRELEYKGLGITTNQNSDTDYLQSTAELQDVYDPVIYNALNQKTVFWNLLKKDNYSGKGNNQVQFTLKTAANASAAFYTGNTVSTDNVTRLKYQTKFKKIQVGVSVDGDMIAAARGGPVSDVFAQEVVDSSMDMLAVVNAALFAEKGDESDAEIIGLEYLTDSAGNANLYNLTRSAANKLAPDTATDTYINMSSAVISMENLRKAITQCTTDGGMKSDLIFVTSPTQANKLRGKFDDIRRAAGPTDTGFGFSTDLFVDGVPIFEDKDVNSDDWFCVDMETGYRAAIWVPPTIERLGKTADNEEAFIKMYFATYSRAPRRIVQIYGCST